ncbi:MAG: hypothetical protein ABF295_09680 [Flavobacteriaceae bacterium]
MEKAINNRESPEFKEFFQGLGTLGSEVKAYLSSSLLAAENQGLIDRRYYDPDGILDEVYLSVYQQYTDVMPETDLKQLLYRKSHEKIQQLIRDEKFTPNDPSTTAILKDELDALDERFTADAEGELLLHEELDDISYKQERRMSETIYLDDFLIAQIVDRFGLKDKFTLAKQKRIHLGLLYQSIPPICKTIVELYTYGRLQEEEIAKILNVEPASVLRVIKIVREKFKLV